MSSNGVKAAVRKAMETPKGHGTVSKAEAETIKQAALEEKVGAPRVTDAEARVLDGLLKGDSFDGGRTRAQLTAPARRTLEEFAVTRKLPVGANAEAMRSAIEERLAHVDTGAPLGRTPSLSKLLTLQLSDQRPVDGSLREALIDPQASDFYLRTTSQSRGQGKLVSYFGPFPLDAAPRLSAAELGTRVGQAADGYYFPSETDVPLRFLVGPAVNAVTPDAVRSAFAAQHDAASGSMFGTTGPALADKYATEVPAQEFLDRYRTAYDPSDTVMVANAAKFAAVADLVKANLSDVHVYRFCEHDPADTNRSAGQVSIFIAGRAASGELVSVMTGAVET